MSTPRSAVFRSFLLGSLVLGGPALSGSALASPATMLFQAASKVLVNNYYGWSTEDRPALVSRYAASLDAECAGLDEACSFDQGREAVKAMLGELHDAHTNIRDAEGAERLREVQADLTVPRTGLRLAKTALGLLVVGVMPGSPAQAAGMQRFDLLTSVNGVPQTGDQADSAAYVRLERQAAPVQLLFERAGRAAQAITLSTWPMKARDVPILSWQQGTGGRVAVIQYPTFLPDDSADLFLKVLRQAQAAGATGLIVDLRYNGGGRLDQCVQAASAFLPTLYQARSAQGGTVQGGTVQGGAAQGQTGAQFTWDYSALEGRNAPPAAVREALAGSLLLKPSTTKLNTPTGSPLGPVRALKSLWHGPTAILIGEHTASCAEVFGYFAHEAGALLVGQPSKGVMNSGVNFFPLPDHGVMSVTMLRAYDMTGAPLPDHLQPDIDLPANLEALTQGQDTALQAAVGALQAQLAGALAKR